MNDSDFLANEDVTKFYTAEDLDPFVGWPSDEGAKVEKRQDGTIRRIQGTDVLVQPHEEAAFEKLSKGFEKLLGPLLKGAPAAQHQSPLENLQSVGF